MDDNELSAKCIESGSGECSQLYETGQQSIVLQSVNREIEAEEQMRQGGNEEGKLQSPIPASIHNSNLGEEEPFEDQVQQTQANTQNEQQIHGESVGDDSVTAAYENIVQHLNRPEGLRSDDGSEPDFTYKKKIILNFDKMDLARKLEEMTKTVNDYKNHW